MALRRKTVSLILCLLMGVAVLATGGTQFTPRTAYAANTSYPLVTTYQTDDCTPGFTRLDVVFLIDQSGSMGSVIDAAKRESAAIAERVRALVADSAFGVASFADYPQHFGGSSSDEPYLQQSAISTSLDELQAGLNDIDLMNGGDIPEAYSRAVFEMRDFNWREGARRVVVLIGDAPPHSQGSEPYADGEIDPGRDEEFGTADDLETFTEAVSAAGGAGISFVALFSEETASFTEEAIAALQYLASATGGRYAVLTRGGSIADPIAEGIAGVVCEGPPPPPPPAEEDEEEEVPAFVTVAQLPTPNLRVVAGAMFTIDIVARNRGEGLANDTTITLPFNPSEVRVVNARSTDEDAWVSRLEDNWLEIRTGPIDSGNVVTVTLALQTLNNVVMDAPLGDWAVYSWDDAEDGGEGRTNLPVLMVGGSNVNVPYYPTAVAPAAGAAGSEHTFATNIFKPNEPVSFWYNPPGGAPIAITRVIADSEGTAGVRFVTTGLAAGNYSIVGYGEWSTITAVGNFEVR